MVDCLRQLVQPFSGDRAAFHPRYFVEYVPTLCSIQSAEDPVGDVSRPCALIPLNEARSSGPSALTPTRTDYLLQYSSEQASVECTGGLRKVIGKCGRSCARANGQLHKETQRDRLVVKSAGTID